MRNRPGLRAILAIATVLVLVAGACDNGDADETTTTAAETTTTVAETTTTTAPPEPPEPAVAVPFLEAWEGSGHADATSASFRHWDEEDPPEVPPSCAKCHSAYGFDDFLGLDGSAFGSVDSAHPTDSVISCTTCHNEATVTLTSAVMPSGVEITGLGSEAVCMQCHQGRQSGVSVQEAIDAAGVDEDTVSEDLRFLNIHYYPAAATKYGTEAMGGYQYEGSSYDAFFEHVAGYETCTGCHDPHTLELKVAECATCHAGMETAEDARDIRSAGSLVDYDGDGDLSEGVAFEIEGLEALLYEAMQAYAAEVIGTGLLYDSDAYPYFFNDSDGDGVASEEEINFGNAFASWTPRLLKAAYNYQVSLKDTGGYAHGGKYVIQLLVDSTADLNEALGDPISLEAVQRIDHGHFAGSEEAFRHWDGEEDGGIVPGSCSRCHAADGLPLWITEGVEISQEASNGLQCATCHNDLATFSIFEVAEVTFPSGLTVDSGNAAGNLCMNCHQGRASTNSVNALTAGIDDDTVSENLRFVNVHFFAAGASLFGTEAKGAYEYEGGEYLGRFEHVEGYDTCTECHSAHRLEVKVDECSACHGVVETLEDLTAIRTDVTDWDGDGDTDEGIAGEIATMEELLYAAIQQYAAGTVGTPITYDSGSYPYFFVDSNENGVADPDEAIFPNGYATWTPRLLRAAYNFQYVQKDPGGYAHGGRYLLQVLYDALVDIGADTSGMTRP